MNSPFSETPKLVDKLRRPLQWSAERWRQASSNLPAKHRQYMTLGAIVAGGVVMMWLTMSLSTKSDAPIKPGSAPSRITHLGVMPAGQQVHPLDQWVGTAGRKLAQYESDRDEQQRLNRDRQGFEGRITQRFAELEQRVAAAAAATASASAPATLTAPSAVPVPAPQIPPPLPQLGTPLSGFGSGSSPPMLPLPTFTAPEPPRIAHVRVSEKGTRSGSTLPTDAADADLAEASFLPVGFVRGTLLGGLDAPTGGQAQSNPHPILIRLSDNAVLPNRFRGEYQECFVIAAGFGDISSERAYLRTESLSCVRSDGTPMEVRLQGTVYGEDGKVGLRGRLVTKQGQMLANALLSGVVAGIGQGVSTSSGTYSQSPLGTVASVDGSQALRAGTGTGVGRALDRLAQYYIKLAENTFPVIEIDAAREVDVVITKGVRIPSASTADNAYSASPAARTASRPNPSLNSGQEALDEGF